MEPIKTAYRKRIAGITALFISFSCLAQTAPPEEAAASKTFAESLNEFFQPVVGYLYQNLFFEVGKLPFIIWVLALGGIFFTFAYGFVNLRLFRHSLDCIRGKYDNPDDEGEISHFKALTSALSATVGLGNIAGVAIAICAGGPGAVFWMWVVAFFGMTVKFNSCTLSQMYRRVDDSGRVLGGPMVYLADGLKAKGLGFLGIPLGYLYAITILLACFGAGALFQGNMSFAITSTVLGFESQSTTPNYVYGFIVMALTYLVMVGGIRRIGEVTSKMVPAMCIFYCLICLIIVMANLTQVPGLIAQIFSMAFEKESLYGGFWFVLFQGVKRGAFSNEAGLGSAAIAHAAAKTREPVREGVVAMIGPFIDTLCVCTMTALAILITGVHEGKAGLQGDIAGASLTAEAFASLHPFFGYFLVPAVIIFAFSTMISWGYYGERGCEFLAGKKGIPVFRFFYVLVAFFGPVLTVGAVTDFTDMLVLSLVFPNIVGSLFLLPQVRLQLNDYLKRLKSGEMVTYK